MRILIVGSGGREHALAWKLIQSPRVERVFVAPGNGGTDARAGFAERIENVGLQGHDFTSLVAFARQAEIGLTVVGPEAPLAAGLVDALLAAGLRVFGPSQDAARLEASKAFAKGFMTRHGIPTGRFACFRDIEAAREYLARTNTPVVIKASGLAAGKGVILPQTPAEADAALRQILVDRAFGDAGGEVLIEERLEGPEASLLAFCDGVTARLMPPAQDHKRIYEGDQGPNTGGMGAYAPAPVITAPMMDQVRTTVIQPTLDGMRASGTPFVGVLYAGLMLTPDGPKVLEFNCRFGDPETQAILPLLESDLLDILVACVEGTLERVEPRWRPGSAATVVASAEGYPGDYRRGDVIAGVASAQSSPGTMVFQAGTRWSGEDGLVTDGGRVLAVTGTGSNLSEALGKAYAGLRQVSFRGMHFRGDIGAKAL